MFRPQSLKWLIFLSFDQATCFCEECNNLLDSKSVFMISGFKNFPIMLLRQLNFGAFCGLTTISCLLQRKNFTFLYL